MRFERVMVVCVILWTALFGGEGAAARQESSPSEAARSPTFLRVERARLELQYWEEELKRMQRAYREGLVSESDLRRTQLEFKRARLDYMLALLEAGETQPTVVLERAYVNRDAEGEVRLYLALYRERELPAGLTRGHHRTGPVTVSVTDMDGTIVVQPYQVRLDRLPVGRRTTVRFRLLEDLDRVRVRLNDAGWVSEVRVRLEPAGPEGRILLIAEPMDQMVELGRVARYRLTIETYGRKVTVVKLQVHGLPPGVRAEFWDPEADVQITQLRLTALQPRRAVELRVHLPEQPLPGLEVGREVVFTVRALPEGGMTARPGRTVENRAESGADSVTLRLVPRGVGRIRLQTENFLHVLRPGDTVQMDWTLYNEGESRLDQIRLQMQMPLQWQVRIEPPRVARLEAGSRAQVRAFIEAPAQVAVGDYEAVVWAEAWAGDRVIRSQEYRVRLLVEATRPWLGSAVLVAFLLLFLIGITYLGVRMVRR